MPILRRDGVPPVPLPLRLLRVRRLGPHRWCARGSAGFPVVLFISFVVVSLQLLIVTQVIMNLD